MRALITTIFFFILVGCATKFEKTTTKLTKAEEARMARLDHRY